jgi:hypothetical protein
MVSLVGGLAGLVCHSAAWLGFTTSISLGLHILAMGLCFLLFAFGGGNTREFLQLHEPLRPRWVGHVLNLLFAYAVINFLIFMARSSQYPRKQVPSHVVHQGFSGHWMLFLGVAADGYWTFILAQRAAHSQVRSKPRS